MLVLFHYLSKVGDQYSEIVKAQMFMQGLYFDLSINRSRSNNCPRLLPNKSDQKIAEQPLDRVRLYASPQSRTSDHVNTDKHEKQKKMEPTNSLVKANPEDKVLKKVSIKEVQKHENKRLRNDHKKDMTNNHEITDDPEEPLGDVRNLFELGPGYQNGIRIAKEERQKASIDYQKSERIGKNCTGYTKREVEPRVMNESWTFINGQKSSEMGYAIGINNLACCNQDVIGVKMDGHKAFDYHQKSAVDVQKPEGKQYSPGTNYQDEINSARTKKRYPSGVRGINEIECVNQKFKMSSCNALNNNAKINKKHGLSNNDLQEMCGAWMDKVALIKDPTSLKKHVGEVGDSIRMKKCKDNGNSPSFSNKKTETIKLHMMNDLVRRADKDRIGDLVKCPLKKDNLGDHGKMLNVRNRMNINNNNNNNNNNNPLKLVTSTPRYPVGLSKFDERFDGAHLLERGGVVSAHEKEDGERIVEQLYIVFMFWNLCGIVLSSDNSNIVGFSPNLWAIIFLSVLSNMDKYLNPLYDFSII
ncbi:hypothetical protein C2G38_2230126 [Gigaspora rosea]|uniref:Uncharacterized protein n=1 Tax=Gigaspora rosea TaxID=44941 RepID=A0A397TXR4_9GLOM|nr:hypothetical protein C2G38_2230126 [Gigaspora rosea]